MPKYDSFWKTTISELSFQSAVEKAANGATDRVAVDGIRQCSPDKNDWYGIVRVRHGGTAPVSKGTLAAHVASLGKILVKDGMLATWPGVVFRFTMDKPGDWLTVRPEESDTKVPRVFFPGGSALSQEPDAGDGAKAVVANAEMTDCLDELRSGLLHRFSDWPHLKGSVPETSGVYTIWDRTDQFLYAGRSDKLCNRLNSHWLGNRANDQFNVYIADRILLVTLTLEQVWRIGTGELRFDGRIRDYIRTNLNFRFCRTNDAKAAEERIRAGRWPYGRTPTLNPL